MCLYYTLLNNALLECVSLLLSETIIRGRGSASELGLLLGGKNTSYGRPGAGASWQERWWEWWVEGNECWPQ